MHTPVGHSIDVGDVDFGYDGPEINVADDEVPSREAAHTFIGHSIDVGGLNSGCDGPEIEVADDEVTPREAMHTSIGHSIDVADVEGDGEGRGLDADELPLDDSDCFQPVHDQLRDPSSCGIRKQTQGVTHVPGLICHHVPAAR
jgi:hypothetical protein